MLRAMSIVVYGATGFTGRLICARLVADKIPFVAAGRDAAKLAALPGVTETVAVDIGDAEGLQRLLSGRRVVLDCAGPFARLGKPVQDAALAARCHFLDVTGEHAYMRATALREVEARAAGIALINSVGFDVIPTDAAAVLAAEAAGAPVENVRIAFATHRSRSTQGTARSMIESLHLSGLAFVDGDWRQEPVGAERWRVPFVEPVGERDCLSIPWGDVATAPRSTGARTVRAFMATPRGVSALVPLLPALSFAFRAGFVRSLGERFVRSQPEGPTDAERARASFAVHVEARGATGTRAVWVAGPDGYDFTAASAVLCARRAAEDSFKIIGTPTPAQAFGARWLLDELAPIGVRWGYHSS
jgi:saccharopine dehydrogenase (NAD+, L-lysine-forming)